MNRKLRRTVSSLMRRQKWSVLAGLVTSPQLFRAMDVIEKMTPAERRSVGRSPFAMRHEEHRRGMVLLRLYA